MNRCGVATELLAALPDAYTKGQLALIATDGTLVEAGVAGPYDKQTLIELFVGLSDGTSKQIGSINPSNFKYSKLEYAAAVGKTVRVGFDGSANKLVVVDPTIATNIGKYGTLSLIYNDLKSLAIPTWGDTFSMDIQIANGDTVTTLYAKVVAAATALAAKINAKYGAGTVTYTGGVPVLNAASSFLQFAFAAGKLFKVTFDGIFDGTAIKTTVGATSAFVSGLTGAEVREAEIEAAILDGYNPNQKSKFQTFDLENYLGGVVGTNYDGLQITTTLPKEYESPDSPSGWEVTFEIYCPTTDHPVDDIIALLDEVKANANGTFDMLTKTAADDLYAAHA